VVVEVGAYVRHVSHYIQTDLIPGTNVAIDKIMARFYGWSSDTYKMPNKPIKQGYKIFALVDKGYIWHFQLSSR
jgi:hypothetical protein